MTHPPISTSRCAAALALILLVGTPGWSQETAAEDAGEKEPTAEETASSRVSIGSPLSLDSDLNAITIKKKVGPKIDDGELEGLSGKKVVLSLTVAEDGTVKEAALLKSTAPGASINDAMVEVAKDWVLDPPTNSAGKPVAESNWTVVVKIK